MGELLGRSEIDGNCRSWTKLSFGKTKESGRSGRTDDSLPIERLPGWTFKAGQSIDMTLIDPPESDSEGNTRAFSIASAPQEDTLMVATRMRDTAFKRTLKGLPLGSTVKIEGPFGNLTLQNNAAKTAVLLAGGIGITPFRSIVFRAAREKLSHRIFLFFSNRRPEDVAALVWASGFLLAELGVMRPIPLAILDRALLTRYCQSLTKETRIGAMPSFRYWVHSSVVPWRAH